MATLRLEWIKRSFAQQAVMWWHYSKAMPSGENYYAGVWEDQKFIGAVIFGRGATPHIGSPWQLEHNQVCELVRVALAPHQTPTSRIVAIAIRIMRKRAPALRMMVSYADMKQDHYGTLYQAGGWVYLGETKQQYIQLKGRLVHPRSLHSLGKNGQSIASLRKFIDPNAKRVEMPCKHKYVLPLDDEIRARVMKDSKPYPKRSAQAGVAGTYPP